MAAYNWSPLKNSKVVPELFHSAEETGSDVILVAPLPGWPIHTPGCWLDVPAIQAHTLPPGAASGALSGTPSGKYTTLPVELKAVAPWFSECPQSTEAFFTQATSVKSAELNR